MSGELSGLIRDHEAELEAGAAGRRPGESARARVVVRARRQHALRTVGAGVAAVTVIGALGAGAWLVLGRQAPVPPVNSSAPVVTTPPTPGPTPTTSATSTTSPTPTQSALPDPGFAGAVAVSDHLPSAAPVDPQVWAEAGPGWVLVSYREAWNQSDAPDVPWGAVAAFGPQVVYLVSPEGDRYQLVELSADTTVHVVAWRPQATSALAWLEDVTSPDAPQSSGWARLDLVSGDLTPVQVDARPAWWNTVLPDGRVLVGDGHQAVGVDGTRSAAPVVDAPAAVAAASAAYPDRTCTVVARYDAETVVVSCQNIDVRNHGWSLDPMRLALDEPRLLRVRDDGTGSIDVLAKAGPDGSATPSWDTVAVIDGTVVVDGWSGWGPDSCPVRYTLDGGISAALPGVTASSVPDAFFVADAGSSGASTYSVVSAGCQEYAPQVLVRDDLATGRHVELVGYPTSGDAIARAGGYGLWQSLTGYYVVP